MCRSRWPTCAAALDNASSFGRGAEHHPVADQDVPDAHGPQCAVHRHGRRRQIDLPRKSDSGLVRTMEILRGVDGIGIVGVRQTRHRPPPARETHRRGVRQECRKGRDRGSGTAAGPEWRTCPTWALTGCDSGRRNEETEKERDLNDRYITLKTSILWTVIWSR